MLEQILGFMHATEILHADQGLFGIGQSGERQFGAKHFMELFSVFVSPPSIKVFHGRQEIGEVYQSTFIVKEEGPAVLTLGGRSWATKYVDWPRRKAYVEPTELRGRSQWLSAGQPLHFALCQAVACVLKRDDPPVACSRRALDHLDGLREVFDWVEASKTFLIEDFIAELKFGECLPQALRDMEIRMRYDCSAAVAVLRGQPLETLWIRTPAQ